MDEKSSALLDECMRLSESCQYTSTSVYIWLRCLRWLKVFFVIVPLVLGSMSGWELLTSSDIQSVRNLVAVFAFLAGLLPAIYAALKFDERLGQYVLAAGEFKNLEHLFRKLSLVDSQKTFAEFESEFKMAMWRHEKLIGMSLTVPEWCFRSAQRKIKSGDYSFDADTAKH